MFTDDDPFLAAEVPIMKPLNLTGNSAHHMILAGSYRSLSLFLLAFSPRRRSLSFVQSVEKFGPHQSLALSPKKDQAYTVNWSWPPSLSSWEVYRPAGLRTGNESEHVGSEPPPWRVHHINDVQITATSSYVNVPPPYTHLYSVGGPTGEVHALDPVSGAIGDKIQELLFISPDQLEQADKTRVALRYGSHCIEFAPERDLAFVPVLGTSRIETYTRNRTTGLLTHLESVPSPRGADKHDGQRHLIIHPNGRYLYCVTEHANTIDMYEIGDDNLLKYITSRSLLPPAVAATENVSTAYRGDTLVLAPAVSPSLLFATTRGSSSVRRGYVSVFELAVEGKFLEADERKHNEEGYYYKTRTSGGRANVIDLLPKAASAGVEGEDEWWIVITDDDSETVSAGGGVRVLEWGGWGEGKGIKEVAGWPGEDELGSKDVWMEGGSHALWLD